MKIWLDFRNFYDKNTFFVNEIIENIKNDKENIYNIYADIYESFDEPNIKIHLSKKYKNFFWEQISFLNKLKNDQNDIVVFFDDTRPIFYSWKSYQVISSLEKVLYPNLSHTKFLKKYSFLHTIKSNYKNAENLICFDEKTKKDINEKLNIYEWKIKVINWFFTKNKLPTSKIDVKIRHNILWEYIIYDNQIWINKNIKRLLESIKEINKEEKLNIVFLWNEVSENLETRQIIVNLWIENLCFFAWNIDEKEIWLYYKNSLWVVYPAINDSFPRSLSNAVFFNTNIIASDWDEIKSIFWNKIEYFMPLSTIDMTKKIRELVKKRINNDYSDIKELFNAKNFIIQLNKIILK